MTDKFTPGPWMASHNTGPTMQGYSQPSCVTGTGKHQMQIVCGCFGDIGGTDVAAANAHLIAAAPDLLQALRDMLAHNGPGDKARAIAAIKKATGAE